MPGLETDATVEKIARVKDQAGDLVAAANERLQQTIADALTNEDSLEAFEYTTSGTGAEALDANAVPDGVSVLVTFLEGNAGGVYVGDSGTQPVKLTAVGDTFVSEVSDTSAIYVQTPNGGDGVGVVFEA
ncbi:hypothetical protein [Halosimplex amylolyticum]|uniref:hypothetical protein n=1 Tax=Halosimplex amylolyticum TaxID=3396616 RepID=UPI003F5721CB